MTPQQLKNSILQMAMQGKLVEQRPEEGTGDELYQQIQKEKQGLIKEGKIKRQKKLPEITEDEVPFVIPESWKWVRLGKITNITMGQSPKGANVSEKKEGIEFHQGKVCFSKIYLQQSSKTTTAPTKIVEPGTILLCVRAPVGTVNITQRQICIGRGLCGINVLAKMDPLFLFLWLKGIEKDFLRKATGTTFISITGKVVEEELIPLPPLHEQKRIVSKIEELLPYLDRYSKAYDRLETYNQKFPDDLRKSILQKAIQGKLVEQRPKEGTGEELYQQIQKEKQKLIKEGKIKKQKTLPSITEEEIPFEIPENWKWVRIGEIFNLQAGKNITSSDIYDFYSDEHPYLCYGGNGQRGYVSNYNRNGKFALIGRQGALCGNINIASGLFYATEHAVVVDHLNMVDVIWSAVFLKAENLNQYATATAQPGLAVWKINQVLIPLPPVAEQQRIVAKIKELMPYIDKCQL